MLRIRNKDGSITNLPLGHFIEMVDEDGKLGAVWYRDGSKLVRIKPGGLEARRYEFLFGDVKFLDKELPLQVS